MAIFNAMRPYILQFIIGAVLLLLLVWGFRQFGDVDYFLQILQQADFTFLMLAFLVMNVLQIAGALRLNYMFKRTVALNKKNIIQSLEMNYLQQILSRVLPFRMGDAVLMAVIQKKFKVRLSDNVAVYTAMRIWDLRLILGFLMFGIFLLYLQDPQFFEMQKKGAQTFVLVAFLVTGFFVLFPYPLIRLVVSFMQKIQGFIKIRLVNVASNFLTYFERDLTKNREVANIKYLVALSFANWFCAFFVFYTIFMTLGIDVTVAQGAVLFSLMILLNILPVHVLGGIGIGEAGIAGILILFSFGVSESLALALAVGLLYSFLVLFLIPIYVLCIAVQGGSGKK